MTTRLSIETFPNQAAADYIKGKAVADPLNFGELPNQLKQRAFAVAGIEQLSVLRDMRDIIAKLPNGSNWDEVKKELAEKISPFVGSGDDKTDAAAAKKRADFMLRTHGFQAYAVSRHQQQMSTAKDLPYWKYETVGDSRVRPGHAALDGKVLRADDPWWKTHYPPWDWGCRCIVIALDEDDAMELGVTPDGEHMPKTDRSGGFTFDASDAGISLDALVNGRDDVYCRMLANKAKNIQVQRDDGRNCSMWDYMVDRHMKTKGRQLVGQTEKENKEHALLLDFTTGKQIGDVVVGDKESVNVDMPVGRAVCSLHTHPSDDNTISPGDLLFGLDNVELKVEYVAAGDRLRRWMWNRKEKLDENDRNLMERYRDDRNRGQLDLEAYEMFLDRLWASGYIVMENVK